MQFSLAIDPFVADLLCLVLVDDRNLRVADFAQFWATAKVYSVSLKPVMRALLSVSSSFGGLTKDSPPSSEG